MFRAVLKVGSQTGALGMKEGMIVAIFPTTEMMSDTMRKVYAIIDLPESLRARAEASLDPLIIEDEMALIRKEYINIELLAAALGNMELVGAWRGAESVDVIDGTGLTESIFATTEGVEWADIDWNSAVPGTYTVGTGGNYTNWTAAIADFPSGSALSGNYTYNQISDTTESGNPSGITMSLNGKTVTLNSNGPHYGNPTAGYKINLPNATSQLFYFTVSTTTGGTLEIKNLHAKSNYVGTNSVMMFWIRYSATSVVRLHDLICTSANTGYGGFGVYCQPTNSSGAQLYVWNVMVSGMVQQGISNQNAYSATVVYENCSVFGCQYGFNMNNQAATVRNCVAQGGTAAFFGHNNCVGRNNASVDSTAANANWSGGAGTGNVTGIVLVNNFVSTTRTSADCGRIKADAPIRAVGQAPTIAGNTTSIRNNPRPSKPGGTEYSIGADEILYTIPSLGVVVRVKVPHGMGERRRGISRVNSPSMDNKALADVLNKLADNLQDIKAASQGTDFDAFKLSMAALDPLEKSDDSKS